MDRIKPTAKQLEFLDWEMGVFFHFGIRTFNEGRIDWDEKHMEPETFNPTELDCGQWIRTIKEAGAKYAILTAKHHDGFANWPSKYTDYSVKNTPWKNGKGDVVKEFTDACRKYDIKVGIYYSPAQFGYKKMSGKEYDDYFINQISELLTNYGKIDYLWFDGCGSENHQYDKDRIIKCIRGLQPEILIFSMWDPDVRWVGNEEGIVPFGSRNVVGSAKTSINLQEEEWLDKPKFLPFECDCKIRRYNWFYSDNDIQYLRDMDDLKGLYENSVGRGGNLLLNIGPDRRGLLPDEDSRRFIDFGNAVKERFANPLDVIVERDGNSYLIKPRENTLSVKTLVLAENLTNGESINGFTVSYNVFAGDTPMYYGKTVGHKQIINITPLFLDDSRQIKIDITDADGDFELDIKAY
ncbi:MAG: alpha-L-fucosidase [Clostridia bacterium]|nr:alpha-L-fucosidase [Clostridia bacterium]